MLRFTRPEFPQLARGFPRCVGVFQGVHNEPNSAISPIGGLGGGSGAYAMTLEEVFSTVPVGSFVRFSGRWKKGRGKLLAKLPNCLDLEVWSKNRASLVLVLHADEALDFEIERPADRARTKLAQGLADAGY